MRQEIREKLQALRLSFAAGRGVQDWLASWWASLAPEDRRMLLAMAGVDDSESMGRRAWRQLSEEQRGALVLVGKRWGRMLEALRWA